MKNYFNGPQSNHSGLNRDYEMSYRKRRIVMKRFANALGIFILALTFSFPAAAEDASTYVIHGIPGEDLGLDPALPVDILVDDAICLLEGFTFGEIAGPVQLAPGTYNFKISLASEDNPCSNAPVIDADVPFGDGEDATVVAHLSEGGAPTASKFSDDLSPIRGGQARLAAHHAAAAPMVDIAVRRGGPRSPGLVIEDVANGDQAAADVRPGGWKIWFAPAGSMDPVFGPARGKLKTRQLTSVYAVGSLENGTFTLIVNSVPLDLN
jgi:hypothetical protein